MALTPRLDLRQGQALVMTPQLQQAIKLLQMSSFELAVYVDNNEPQTTPLLERDEAQDEGGSAEPVAAEGAAAEAPADGEAPPDERRDAVAGADTADAAETWHEEAGREGEGNLDYAGDPEAWKTRSGTAAADGLPGLDQTLTRPVSLREHLLEQLAVEIHDPADRVIGSHLIDLLDEAGYITSDFTAIAELLSCDVVRVEKTMALLQRFDPAGIFARNLAECLALQLKERDRFDPAMQALVENLPLLDNRDAQQLMRVCRVDAADLAQMVAEIMVTDVLLRALPDGSWAVELNSESLPRVLVNNRYYAEVSGDTRNKKEKEYLSERYQSANWLVKALHQRATTILKVSREIVRQQDGFLRHGVQHLKPLILRDIAFAIEMHESTVSRVTTNKYILTPRGIYELKYFFTSAIAAASGEAHSAEAVRFRIRMLIEAETGEILSDDRIVEILLKEGIDIARRTVAKYREAMNIPSSVRRRREKALQL